MKAMRDVWGDTLVALGKANPNVLVLDADLANSTKADKFAKACPERFLQMGIAEQKLYRCCCRFGLSRLYPVAFNLCDLFHSPCGRSDPYAGRANACQREARRGLCRRSNRTYG